MKTHSNAFRGISMKWFHVTPIHRTNKKSYVDFQFHNLTVTLRTDPGGPMTPEPALRAYYTTSYLKNVSKDSPWNSILNILVISAQTGSQILKTAFTGNWNRKWKLYIPRFLLCAIIQCSYVTLTPYQVRKISTSGPTGPAWIVGVNFFVAWVLTFISKIFEVTNLSWTFWISVW